MVGGEHDVEVHEEGSSEDEADGSGEQDQQLLMDSEDVGDGGLSEISEGVHEHVDPPADLPDGAAAADGGISPKGWPPAAQQHEEL